MVSSTLKTRVLLLSMPDTFIGFSIASTLPNLGLASIAANCDSTQAEVRVFDLVTKRKTVIPSLKKVLDQFKPEIVGLNCMTFQYFTARGISKWIKTEYDKNITIIMGGYHPSLCFNEICATIPGAENAKDDDFELLKSNPFCDFVVRGEGEVTFREFIAHFRTDRDYSGILGLSWRDTKGNFVHNAPRECLDLDSLKLPDRSVRYYSHRYHIAGWPADVVETSRGCNNKCKFCSIRQMYGENTGIRYYKLERVIEDIENCVKFGALSILFIDDHITQNTERLEKLCDMIIEEKKKKRLPKILEFHTQASAAGLLSRPKLIEKMGKAGFNIIFFGIENISKANLKFFKKSIPILRLKELVQRLHKANMISFGGFILGNPNDHLEDLERNLIFARYLNLDFPAFQVLTPFPKTEIREEIRQAGLLTNEHNYKHYHGLYANVRTNYLDQPTLEKEILRYYYRYYTLKWFLSRFRRIHIVSRYIRYAFMILKKYAPLAISTWIQEFKLKKLGVKKSKAEIVVLKKFENIRDHRLDSLLSK